MNEEVAPSGTQGWEHNERGDGRRGPRGSRKGLLKNVNKRLLKSLRKDKQQIGTSQKRSAEECSGCEDAGTAVRKSRVR